MAWLERLSERTEHVAELEIRVRRAEWASFFPRVRKTAKSRRRQKSLPLPMRP